MAQQQSRSQAVLQKVDPVWAKIRAEAGTIGSAACLVNAVCDALAPLGIVHIDKPLTPARVWAAIQAAKATGSPGKENLP